VYKEQRLPFFKADSGAEAAPRILQNRIQGYSDTLAPLYRKPGRLVKDNAFVIFKQNVNTLQQIPALHFRLFPNQPGFGASPLDSLKFDDKAFPEILPVLGKPPMADIIT
jgi:hypothetical protein